MPITMDQRLTKVEADVCELKSTLSKPVHSVESSLNLRKHKMEESEHTPAGRLPNFCLDKGVQWCVESESDSPFPSCLCRKVIGGFTAKGGVAAIANQLGVVAKTLILVRTELLHASDSEFTPSAFLINGMLASAATGLQNVLDATASLCHICNQTANTKASYTSALTNSA